jgi:hypothetical protein
MTHEIRLDLIAEMRRLLEVAGTDEQAAVSGFHSLLAVHSRAEIGMAVAAVTAEFLGAGRDVRAQGGQRRSMFQPAPGDHQVRLGQSHC